MRLGKKLIEGSAFAAAVLVALALSNWAFRQQDDGYPRPKVRASAETEIGLNDKQAGALEIEKVDERIFGEERRAVGSIDFNQNRLVQVFTPYQGRIIDAYFNIGDRVEKDQVLFTIDSPDLLQAGSNLIAASGVLTLQTRSLNRVKSLVKIGGVSQQAVDQTISDQQTAEGTLKSARDAVRIFGKTEEEIDKIVAERRADPRLIVKSPLAGYVTARAASPGLFVQPGVAPAPYAVADTSTMWMLANVVESDAPLLRVGQDVHVSVAAYPDREFQGAITVLGPSVDPTTRRMFVRSEIKDPDHLLRAGMFADFVIRVGASFRAPAAPESAIVRKSDGTMTAWITQDRRRFKQRTVKIGLRQNGFDQIEQGLSVGELIISKGAVFLDNLAAIGAAE
jgi:cobalt-zinc-cadmium efflux system membrane fusion protein